MFGHPFPETLAMRSIMFPLLLLVAAAAVPCAANAQSDRYPEVLPGARIRVTAPGVLAGRYVGTVLTRDPDTVVVANSAGAQVRVPIASMTSLEVSRGKSRMAGFKRGLIWGAPVGLGLGLASMSVADDTDRGDGQTWGQGEWVAYNVLGGAMWGGFIGALVGRERWDAYARQPHVSLRPVGRRLGVGLAFSL